MLTIGFIGNFIPPFSTENDRMWSFEKLGHVVVPFQENKTTSDQLISAMRDLDMLVYSHTHDPSYAIRNLVEVFREYKRKRVPTVSVHLDRWAWLKRVEDVGKEATWFTEYIFMADGSPEAVELYEQHNLNWHYLPGGVIERDCYIAEPDHQKFPHEIVFTGSRGYHPEYPFRRQLIDFLKATYGNKFGHYGNDGIRVVRMGELNTLYSTAKIVIGDSCFGGRPNYVSERYQEVRGRGGFLLHPKVEGLEDYGVAHYVTCNLHDLAKQIDYWLVQNEAREAMRQSGHEWVKNNETYTDRAKQILQTVGLNG